MALLVQVLMAIFLVMAAALVPLWKIAALLLAILAELRKTGA